MPDVRTQIANMMTSYEKYVNAKKTSAGVAATREKELEVEREQKKKASG